MHAFKEKTEPTPPRTAPVAISHAVPPAVPPKEKVRVEEPPKDIRRPQEGTRRPSGSARRRTSEGGLTGTYSTSVPSGGGYFPDPTPEEDDDEEAQSRKARYRAREEKQRALKAAWGIDTRKTRTEKA